MYRIFLVTIFCLGVGFYPGSASAVKFLDCPDPDEQFSQYIEGLGKCLKKIDQGINVEVLKQLSPQTVEIRYSSANLEEPSSIDRLISMDGVTYNSIANLTAANPTLLFGIHKSLNAHINQAILNKAELSLPASVMITNMFDAFMANLPSTSTPTSNTTNNIKADNNSKPELETATNEQVFGLSNKTLLVTGATILTAAALGGGGGGGCSPINLSLTMEDGQVEEGGVEKLTVSIPSAEKTDRLVSLTVHNTTAGYEEFTLDSTIVIPAGQLFGVGQITALNDATYEQDEHVTIIARSECAQQTSNTVYIVEDNGPVVSISVDRQSTSEAAQDMLLVTVSTSEISYAPIDFIITTSGDASEFSSNGNPDYTMSAKSGQIVAGSQSTSLNIVISDDNIYEGEPETLILSLNNVSGSNAQNGVSVSSVSILDDENPPTITLTSSTNTVDERSGSATITATASGIADEDIILTLSITGDVAPGVDYTHPTTITIPALSGLASTTFTPIDDEVYEGDEEVSISITNLSGANASTNVGQTTNFAILDDENPPTITLTSSTNTVDERSGSATITATASGIAEDPIVVTLSASGSATANTDYIGISEIIIPSLTLTGNKTFTPISDTAYESSPVIAGEVATLDVLSVSNGIESGIQSVSITITEQALNAGVQLAYDETLAETRRTSDEFTYFSNSSYGGEIELERINLHKAHGYGLRGAGNSVMITDNCYRGDHPDLTTSITRYGNVDSCNGVALLTPANDHGLIVAGIVAADDNGTGLIGVSPGVNLLHVDNGNNSIGPAGSITNASSRFSKLAESYKYATNEFYQPPIASNNSWGYPTVQATDVRTVMAIGLNDPSEAIAFSFSLLVGINETKLSVDSLVQEINNFQEHGVIVWSLDNDRTRTSTHILAALPEFYPQLEEAWITAVNIDISGAKDNETYTRKSAPCLETAEYCLGADAYGIRGLASNGSVWLVNNSGSPNYTPYPIYGTSYVAPMISGALALLAEAFPNHTPEELVDRLLASADNVWPNNQFIVAGNVTFGNGVQHSYSTEHGHGIMDIYAALQPITSSSTPLSGLSVYAGALQLQNNVGGGVYALETSGLATSLSFGDSISNGLSGQKNYFYDAMNGGFAYDVGSHIVETITTARLINLSSELHDLRYLDLVPKKTNVSDLHHSKIGDETHLVKFSLTRGMASLATQNFLKNDTTLLDNLTDYETPYLSRYDNGIALNAYIETDKRTYYFGFKPKMLDIEPRDNLTQFHRRLRNQDGQMFDMANMWHEQDSFQPFGGTNATVNLTDTDDDNGRQSQAITLGLKQNISDESYFSIITGLSEEENAFIGLRGSGAFTLEGADTVTTFAGINLTSQLNETLAVKAVAIIANSQMNNSDFSMLSEAQNVRSNALAISAEKTMIFGNDRLEVSISQPNRISDGSMNVRLSGLADHEGNLQYRNHKINLSPTGRQMDFAFGYANEITRDFSVSGKLVQTSQLSHRRNANSEMSAYIGARYKNILMGAVSNPSESELLISYSTQF